MRIRRRRAAVYIGMLTVHTPGLLLALQLLNAIYIGILAGIGMLYFRI
jgi:SET family sugar efflux transporter-like MFS transporter